MTMVIVSPLRIRLWDPFQMAYMAYNWDDPPSMETSTQLWKHIHPKLQGGRRHQLQQLEL